MTRIRAILSATAFAAVLSVAAPAAAKERSGTVIAMDPIENRGDDEAQSTKKKRSIGTAMGGLLGTVAGVKVGGSVGMAAMTAGPQLGGKAALVGDKPLPTQYMVKVKLDSGKTLTLSQYRVNLQGVDVGSRVMVEGKGGSARLRPVADGTTETAPLAK
ncbi:MAG: hypothetical protein U0S50_10405 [Sphingopyxis sp.]|uniref:hypothetical protein n=1 Tax=Sphingopyxis sp. TaxID=1908224 RepID=UPI002ABC8C93|nr:hypothetical protein [Sphingopyxis sp.]MDZ3832216.1 hypothetical protein [Sphingopyxis sp.]